MTEKLAQYGLQYIVYLLEVALVAMFLLRGQWKRLTGVFLYVVLLFSVDAAGRQYVLYHYGEKSPQYAYFYWLTDVLLALGAFLLVCELFRRACVGEQKMWQVLRLSLIFVFLLVLGISALSLARNYDHLFSIFIVEFSQNLYFTCLVLNTLLYILMQQLRSADDELGLLVCGLGIQFAGPAATFALFHLMVGQSYAPLLMKLVMPLCSLGSLLIWLYTAVRVPSPVTSADLVREAGSVEEAPVSIEV